MRAFLALIVVAFLCDVYGFRLKRNHREASEAARLEHQNQPFGTSHHTHFRCNAPSAVNNKSQCEPFDCVVIEFTVDTLSQMEDHFFQIAAAAVSAAGYPMKEMRSMWNERVQTTDKNGKQWGELPVPDQRGNLPDDLTDDVFPLRFRVTMQSPGWAILNVTLESPAVVKAKDGALVQQLIQDARAAADCTKYQLNALGAFGAPRKEIWTDRNGNDLGMRIGHLHDDDWTDLEGMAEDRYPILWQMFFGTADRWIHW